MMWKPKPVSTRLLTLAGVQRERGVIEGFSPFAMTERPSAPPRCPAFGSSEYS